MYYQEELETMPRLATQELQLKRAQDLVKYVYERIPLYTERFDAAGVKPEDLKTLADLPKFPFTIKQDLRDSYPFGMFAVPMDQVARIHCSSGTTGTVSVVGYTKNDLEEWADCIARWIRVADCGPEAACRLHTATVCKPAAWASITAERRPVARLFPRPPATLHARCACCPISVCSCWPAPPATR